VREISGDLKAKGITTEELERSLKPILTGIKDLMRTNAYWLDRVLTGSTRHPQQLTWSRSFAADYGAVTREELQKLAAAYLDNEKAATVFILPRK
jgi:zinc protease